MTRTKRNPMVKEYWFRKESKIVRVAFNRSIRKKNKVLVKKGRDIIKHYRTEGWLTW